MIINIFFLHKIECIDNIYDINLTLPSFVHNLNNTLDNTFKY